MHLLLKLKSVPNFVHYRKSDSVAQGFEKLVSFRDQYLEFYKS